MAMEFWGEEVKAGQPLQVDPEVDYYVHLSQAALGETKDKGKKDKESRYVSLYLKHGDKKLVIGHLSKKSFPQLSFDLVLSEPFELSHNSKDASVYFTGYKIQNSDAEYPYIFIYTLFHLDHFCLVFTSEEEDSENPSGLEVIPGKPEASGTKPVGKNKPDSTAGNQKVVNIVEPKEDSDYSTDSRDDSDDSSDDDKAAGPSKKRSVESGSKTPVTKKQAKLVTPEKSDGKKPSGHVHVATPYPHKGKGAKQLGKPEITKNPGGLWPCKICNKLFTKQRFLESHLREHDY
ncbi:hypothetical protein ACFE04_000545 [Oxalis oulophora]